MVVAIGDDRRNRRPVPLNFAAPRLCERKRARPRVVSWRIGDLLVTLVFAMFRHGAMAAEPGDRQQLVAAWSRVVLGLMAVFLLPFLYPGFGATRWVFGIYVGLALCGQVLIYKGIGGQWRSFIGGLVDMAAVTFLVHRVGTMGNMMVSIYFFAVIVNTLVVGRRVGLGLALVASGSYAGVVLAEQLGALPYGPDGPAWAGSQPTPTDAFVAASLMSLMLLGSGALAGVLVTRIRDREAQLTSLASRLEELSRRDPLTKLFNRRFLMERLETELARVRRGNDLAVLMIDLDRFKRVNDERGHHAGDQVLSDIAAALAEATREVDVPGRYGGDEFVVLLPDTGPRAALRVAERLVASVRAVGERFDADTPVTASVGLSFARHDDDARGLVQRADEHAYRAKDDGGDAVRSEPILADWDETDDSRVRPASRMSGPA